jgi:hypothetical protein
MKRWLLVTVAALLACSPMTMAAPPARLLAQANRLPELQGAQLGPIQEEFVAGDTVHVIAGGTVGAKVTFDVGTHLNQPMTEFPGGTYRGTYVISAADHFRGQAIIIHMTFGNQTVSRSTQETITVGAKVEVFSVETDARGPVHVGDVVNVTVRGTPAVRASGTVGTTIVALRESSPGVYTGQLRVGVDQHSARVQATLTRGTRTASKDGILLTIDSTHH